MPTPTGFIGVVHVPPMPGDPGWSPSDGGFDAVFARAMADADALVEGGVQAIVVENFGSAPFPKGTRGDRLPPHQVALLARVAAACLGRGVLVGVNCLRNDAQAALGIAAATGLDFIRVNVHTGAYVTDQGLIEGEAADTLRYRQLLHAQHVAILADVLVKHAAPLAPLDPATATRDCLLRGHADAVIVTGQATGAGIDRDLLGAVHAAAPPGSPVLLGSGVTPDTAPTLAPLAHGAIVGTWLKRDGQLKAPVDAERVRRMRGILDAHLRKL